MLLSKKHKWLSKTHRNDVLSCTTQRSWIVQLKGSELYNSKHRFCAFWTETRAF